MSAGLFLGPSGELHAAGRGGTRRSPTSARKGYAPPALSELLVGAVSACPWGATAGLGPPHRLAEPRPLYSAEERARRDATVWTRVQAVLAPLQFAVFAVSLVLIGRYLLTGRGYGAATASILLKTGLLYTIMITGSIWEREVFGKWLFADSFFWEDAISMIVMALQTAYVAALVTGFGTPRGQMLVAAAAYAAYLVNATQFLMKLRAARRDVAPAAA